VTTHQPSNKPPRRATARTLAQRVLLDVEQHETAANETLDEQLRRFPLEARDRALAQELIYGVLRHRSRLDWRLDQVASKPMAKLPAHIRTVLRLGAYQLLCLHKIPPSAAVNESVSLVKTGRTAPGYWTGFVNAVLRALIRTDIPEEPADGPVPSLSIRHSCPPWLTERWIARFGTERAAALCEATTTVPPLTIRANTLRISRDVLQAGLAELGYQARSTAVSPVGLVLEKCGSIEEIPLFHEGLFYVEDEAAQLIPLLLDPQPGELVLDACAAPGGKTTHLAARMENQGEIIALDRSAARLKFVGENCRRLGITIVHPIRADATAPFSSTARDRHFDRILVDAPCSGLGVLRRHPEAKWRKEAASLARHPAIQRQTLDQVSRLLRPGGVLVYSTCSSEPEENEQVIDQFCREHQDFHRESIAPWLPPSGSSFVTIQGDLSTMSNDQSMDLFFAARLRKAS